jgi:alpha-tubulin suppressor-like RCC1 family protein
MLSVVLAVVVLGACDGEQSTGLDRDLAASITTMCTFACLGGLKSGWNHSCVSDLNVGERCWGDNRFGQLGTGDKINRLVPTAITINPAYGIAALGEGFTCATSSGSVYCWGDNSQGQLGNGTTVSSITPVRVNGPANLGYIVAGRNFACGVVAGVNKLYCWGANDQGQLGVGDRTNRLVPTAVVPTYVWNGSSLVAGGAHACGGASGAVRCWGDNAYGQLGTGDNTDRLSPGTPVVGSIQWQYLTAGSQHTCGYSGTHLAYCWGSNAFGQLGDYGGGGVQLPATNHNTPQPVGAPLTGVDQVVAGQYHTCAKAGSPQRAYCWGRGTEGQLGDGQLTTSYRSPRLVLGNLPVQTLAAGAAHNLMITGIGAKVYSWGFNAQGQLGVGTTQTAVQPIQVLP